MAENEFSAMEQFMQTVGLQIDDVAWGIGRTQTIRYASRYGQVDFQSATLNYSVYVNKSSSWVLLLTKETGIILFNMPVSKYSLGNEYHKCIFPSSDSSFLQMGTSAPVAHVFVVEKLPMADGSYIRIVAAPSIRMLNSTIKTESKTTDYFKFYLPYLVSGQHPRLSQSITMTGINVSRVTESEVYGVKIDVAFPNAGLGFNNTFFEFKYTSETYPFSSSSVVEFYIGEVKISLGQYA